MATLPFAVLAAALVTWMASVLAALMALVLAA